MNKLNVKIFVAYLLSNILMLLNRGVFWDDWTVYNMSFEGLKQQWMNNTMFFPMYIYNFLNGLPNPIFWYRLISLGLGLFILWEFLKVLRSLRFFSEEQLFAIGLILSVTPLYHVRILLISIQYSVCLLSFLVATRLLIKYFDNTNYILRIVAFILFFFSFIISSLVVFYIAVVMLLFVRKYLRNTKDILTHIDLFLLPCLFWIFKLHYLKPGGLHALEGYNTVSISGILHSPSGVVNSVKDSFFAMLVMMMETLTRNFSIIVIILTILFAFVFKSSLYSANQPEHRLTFKLWKVELSNLQLLLLAGIILFILGAFAYVVVDKTPSFTNFNARNQLLLPFGTAIILMSLTELFIKTSQRKWVYAFIISSCIIINIQKMLDYQKDYFRQSAIIENLRDINLDHYTTIMVIDSSLKFVETETSQVVYTGMVKLVTGNQNHLVISKAKAEDMIKAYGNLTNLLIDGESLNLKDWTPSAFDSKLHITNGSLDLSSLSTTIKLIYYSWFKSDLFKKTVKDAVVLNIEPIIN